MAGIWGSWQQGTSAPEQQVLKDRNGPDLVGQVPWVKFWGSGASEPHGAGALPVASASSDSLGRGRVPLHVSLQDKRDPCGLRGLAPRLSIPKEEGAQRQRFHLEPGWSPACSGTGRGSLRGHVCPCMGPLSPDHTLWLYSVLKAFPAPSFQIPQPASVLSGRQL